MLSLAPAGDGSMAAGNGALAARAPRPVRDAMALLREWLRRRRTRHELATLDERMLRDIGLTRADFLVEASKPFWRL